MHQGCPGADVIFGGTHVGYGPANLLLSSASEYQQIQRTHVRDVEESQNAKIHLQCSQGVCSVDRHCSYARQYEERHRRYQRIAIA